MKILNHNAVSLYQIFKLYKLHFNRKYVKAIVPGFDHSESPYYSASTISVVDLLCHVFKSG